MGLAQVENDRSISVSEHEENIGDDPVMLFANKNYHARIFNADFIQRMTFDEFQEREMCRFPKSIYLSRIDFCTPKRDKEFTIELLRTHCNQPNNSAYHIF